MKTRQDLHGEIRYAIRLCERTARLYRRVQTTSIFLAIIGGSAVLARLEPIPSWLQIWGAILFACAGAAMVAIRPADRASQNEADIRRYQALLAKSVTMDEIELAKALEEARQGDAPEIEALRDVAYNDVAEELGRPDAKVSLTPFQSVLAAIA